MENNKPEESETVRTGDLIQDGKNKETVFCLRCPSKILGKGMGSFKEIEFNLPFMKHKAEGDPREGEVVNEFWQVNDMYTFENIGFSKTLEGIKYLICADCEIGPIGWHSLDTKLNYVALSRVKHAPLDK